MYLPFHISVIPAHHALPLFPYTTLFRSRELAALQIRRQKLVQDNQTPFQPEQRIDRLDSRLELAVFGEAVEHARGETPLQFRRDLHRRVQQKIRDELGRVVPAKVFEVEKRDWTAAPPQS